MYIHDYYLGMTNLDHCGNGSTACVNSWLNAEMSEWLISHYDNDAAWVIQSDSSIWKIWHGGSAYVRPVFYLTSDIKIISGDGTVTNPYIII